MDGHECLPRNFLILQGNNSQFFRHLGSALMARGHRVRRVNFHGGDWLFWRLPSAVDYRGTLDDWPDFLRPRLAEWGISDLILFGDCRPLHRSAIALAVRQGIVVHVFEEGYLRPNWITFEQGGVNGHSSMPREPAFLIETARGLPPWDEGVPVGGNSRRRIIEDAVYNAMKILFTWRYPGYRTHRPWSLMVEFGGKMRRFARRLLHRRHGDAQGVRTLTQSGRPYFFFPLQLDSDSQIRKHSPFGRMARAIEFVVGSFASHAPGGSLLVIKEHPLDNGLLDWRLLAERIAAATGVADRMIYLEDTDVEQLVRGAQGVVTVNSTVGSRALAHGVPIITLGSSVYDMPGLTFQGSLDDFWHKGSGCDRETFDAFRRVLAARHMVNGGFFTQEGLALAVAASVSRLEAVQARPPVEMLTPKPKSARERTPVSLPPPYPVPEIAVMARARVPGELYKGSSA